MKNNNTNITSCSYSNQKLVFSTMWANYASHHMRNIALPYMHTITPPSDFSLTRQ